MFFFKPSKETGLFYGGAATLLWASPAVISVTLYPQFTAFSITFWIHVFALAALLLVALLFFRFGFGVFAALRVLPGASLQYALLAGVSQALSYLTFHAAVQNGPRISTAILHFCWPLFFAAYGWVRGIGAERRVEARQFVLLVVAFVGAALLIANPAASEIPLSRGGQEIAANWIWYGLAVLSALFAGGNSIAYKYAVEAMRATAQRQGAVFAGVSLRQNVSLLLLRVGVGFVVALFALLCGFVWFGPEVFQSGLIAEGRSSGILLIYLGIGTYVAAHVCFNIALERLPSASLAAVAYLTPVLAVVLLALAGEPLSLHVVAGAALILAVNWLLQGSARER